jgi:hypothetical protein
MQNLPARGFQAGPAGDRIASPRKAMEVSHDGEGQAAMLIRGDMRACAATVPSPERG